MTRSIAAIFAILAIISASSGRAQSEGAIEQLKACARMNNPDNRFVCFEELGRRVLGETSSDQQSIRQQAARPEDVTPPPTIIVESVPEIAESVPDKSNVPTLGNDQDPESVEFRGMLTSCQQGHFGDWYFVLDNGEVWKEVKRRKRRFEDCNFEVTITKDFFGFNLQIEALGKTIRVKRYK